MSKVLIVYASARGTTLSIAERIETHLTTAKANIEAIALIPISMNISPSVYDAVIIGSCIHNQSWLHEAKTFLNANAVLLAANNIPVWAFSVGMPPAGKLEMLEEEKMEKWLKGILGESLKGHKLFGGRWGRDDIWWGGRWLWRILGGKELDRRDWVAVEMWTDGILEELRKGDSQVAVTPVAPVVPLAEENLEESREDDSEPAMT